MENNRYIKILFLIVSLLFLAAGAWWYYYNNAFVALPYNDAMDYASMARNINEGRGFTSRYITPLSLAHFGKPYPNLWRAPLWPLFLAAVFRFFGTSDTAAAAAGAFFYFAAIIPLFLLSKEISGSRGFTGETAGTVTCILYIFSPMALFYSVSGMTESMALFFLVLWVFLLYKTREGGCFYFLLTGLAAGLFYLVRYNALIFLPLSLLYLWWSGKLKTNRAGKLAAYLGGWLLAVSPWLWRNYMLTGNPFFSLQAYEPAMFTSTYPGYTLYMLPEIINVKAFLLEHPREILIKTREGLEAFRKGILDPAFTGTAPFIAALFLPGLLSPGGRKLKSFIASCFFAQLAALLLIHYIPRLFFIFLPFYLLTAASLLGYILSFLKNPLLRNAALAAVVTAALLTNVPPWHEGNTRQNWPLDYAEAIQDVSRQISGNDVVISNDGHILSWYADRLALKMPVSLEQVTDLEKMAPVKGIWLSNRFRWGNTPEADHKWLEIMREKPLELGNYYLFSAYEDGSLLYLRHPGK